MLCDLIEKIIVRTQLTADALGNIRLREEMAELNKIKSEVSRISGTIGSAEEDSGNESWPISDTTTSESVLKNNLKP